MRFLTLSLMTVALACAGCTSESAVSVSSDTDPSDAVAGNPASNTTSTDDGPTDIAPSRGTDDPTVTAQPTTDADAKPASDNNGSADSTSADGAVTVQILDYKGIMALIAKKQGKIVVMDAWSTFCEPCIKEFPGLVALHKKYPQQVACISLSFNYEGLGKPEEQIEEVLPFLKEQGATFDNLLSTVESDALHKKFELPAIPAVFVYGKDGKLVKRFDNSEKGSEPFTYKDVDEFVAQLVEAK